MTGSVCHSAARRYQWLRRISPQKCSISVSSAGAGSKVKRTACSSASVGTRSGRKRRRYSISTSECFCSSKNQTLMKAEKSLSSRLSRRNISVAGSAAHSVMAFILMVCACSSVSRAASNSVPWDVDVHVPADRLELLEQFGIEHRGSLVADPFEASAGKGSATLRRRAKRDKVRYKRPEDARTAPVRPVGGRRKRAGGPNGLRGGRISRVDGTRPAERRQRSSTCRKCGAAAPDPSGRGQRRHDEPVFVAEPAGPAG